jgi:hypothetical protein
MKTLISAFAAVLIWNLADAQVGSTVKQGAKATDEKAAQYGDQAKAAVSSQPNKAADKAKAQAHKAKAHNHAKSAKDSAKQIPK